MVVTVVISATMVIIIIIPDSEADTTHVKINIYLLAKIFMHSVDIGRVK